MLEGHDVRVVAAVLLAFVGFGEMLLFRARRGTARGATRVTKEVSISILYEAVWLILGNMSIIVLVVVVAVPEAVYDSPLNFPFAGDLGVQLVGIVLYLVSGLLLLTSVWYLGEFFRTQIEVREGHRLITSGPYATIRHPIYSAAILGSIAAVLLLLNTALIVVAVAVFAIAYHRAKLEEALLSSEDAFGQSYVRYRERTGMFFPKLSGLKGSRDLRTP